MSINSTYKKANETYKKLSWWLNDPFNMIMKAHIEYKFGTMFNNALKKEYMKLHPKTNHQITVKMLETLEDDVIAPYKALYQKRALSYLSHKQHQLTLLDTYLNDNAKNIDFTAVSQICYFSEFHTYSTQSNKSGYAHADCVRRGVMLDSMGIPFDISPYFLNDEYEKTIIGIKKDRAIITKKPVGYCIIAAIEPFMMDAIERIFYNGKSILDLAMECWHNNQNPKVIYPFLSDEVYYQSMEKI